MTAFGDFRADVAAVLATLDPDWPVHDGPPDSLTPPAFVLVWADPWVVPETVCHYRTQLQVVCVAARIDPDPGYLQLEAMVAAAVPALRASVPLVSVGIVGPFESGGLQYLSTRVTLAGPSVSEDDPMPLTVVSAPPFFLVKPILTVGDTAVDGVQYECGANEIDASPEQDSNDDETFCGTYTSYKPAKWTVTVTCLQSYGATALWNNLRPLVNTIQPFTILPNSAAAVSVDNPLMSGNAYIPEFAFLTASVGESSEFDFVLAVQGIPEFLETAPTGFAAPPSSDDEVEREVA